MSLAWTVRDGKVTPLGWYAGRGGALDDLGLRPG
jgi:hypothetical protein